VRKRFESTKARANFPKDASDRSDGPDEKHESHHVEQIHTNERIPGHSNYYEKNGLRTYGDDADHDHEPKMSFARIMSLIAMAFRKILSLDSRYFIALD
jgi:hypothetical protein